MNRRVWLFYPDQVGRSLLGPGVRIFAIARLLAEAGHDVHVALGEGSDPVGLPGTQHVLDRRLLNEVRFRRCASRLGLPSWSNAG